MKFHTFGSDKNPPVILIHGTLTPWQIWERQIEHFKKNYYVVIPALDAHEEEISTEFLSLDQQAQQIEDYIIDNLKLEPFAVCGISMGGAIASVMWRNGIVGIKNLVMDSAPIMPMGKLAAKVMTGNYIKIISNSKKRDPKTLENFKKHFLPEKYLDSFLKIADNMTETSIRNMLNSVCENELCLGIPHGETNILYMHGTKGTEFFQMKCAAYLKKHYPETKVICFRKAGHCEAAIYKPEKWLEVVDNFLNTEDKTDDK